MLFYGVITYIVIVVIFNLPFLMEKHHFSSGNSGLMISLSIAALLAMILSAGSQFLANQILLESRLWGIPSSDGTVHSIFSHPRLRQWLLLWYAADQGSGRVPDHRTADPYGRCLSPGPVFPSRANPHYHGTGCSGTPGRRSRFLLLRSAHLSDLRPYCFLTVSAAHLIYCSLHALRRP